MNERADNVTNYGEAILVLKEYETIIRSEKKGILNLAYRQGIIFNMFKQSETFVEMLKKIGVTKFTVYFKAKLVNILDKYPKLKKLSLSLNFLKAT